jgi:hypothetical protein
VVQPKDIVLAIFAGASAIGALILFFLGFVMSAIKSLPATAGGSVKQPYKNIASVTFAAFVLSILCLALGLCWLTLSRPYAVYVSLVWVFVAQLVFLTITAIMVLVRVLRE